MDGGRRGAGEDGMVGEVGCWRGFVDVGNVGDWGGGRDGVCCLWRGRCAVGGGGSDGCVGRRSADDGPELVKRSPITHLRLILPALYALPYD